MSEEKDHMHEFFEEWEKLAFESEKTGDYEIYKVFLNEAYKMFMKLLVDFKRPEWKELAGNISKKLYSELQRVRKKETKKNLPF